MQFFFVRCGRHCAKARSFTICTHKLQSGEKLRLALALHPAKKKLVKKDWCHTGKPSETKQHHEKRAAHSPSQKCASPSQDTEAGDTRKVLLTNSTLSASMATVRVRSAPLQLEVIKKAKGSTPPGAHRYQLQVPSCQARSVSDRFGSCLLTDALTIVLQDPCLRRILPS